MSLVSIYHSHHPHWNRKKKGGGFWPNGYLLYGIKGHNMNPKEIWGSIIMNQNIKRINTFSEKN